MTKIWLLALFMMVFAQAEPLVVYNSYLSPPFVIGDGGFAADTVNYLNRKLDGKFELKLTNTQRAKLNFTALDNATFKGAVLFMAPIFVSDTNKTKYNWTDAIVQDANVLAYPLGKNFDYTGLESLDGKTLLCVQGYKFPGLDERTTVKRQDGVSEEANIKKLLAGQGDVSMMAKSIFNYFSNQPEFKGKIAIASKPYATFARYILVGKANPELYAALNGVVKGMSSDPDWKAIEKKYSF